MSSSAVKVSVNDLKKINPFFKKLKILFVGSEAAPFAKAGGLGDVLYSLPLALKSLGHDTRVMIPRYGTIDEKIYKLKKEKEKIEVPTDQPGEYPFLVCNVKKYSGSKAVTTYFLENMEYYEQRANIYGYSDDHIRWALLCRGTLEFIKQSKWKPDVIVASDWQTGLIPNYLKTKYRDDPAFKKTSCIFKIHNLYYQGMCDFKFAQESERDSGQEEIPDFFNPRLAKLNWLLRGIIYSDIILTVSPTYAKEILTPEYGEGMDKILSEKQHMLHGILNGINYEDYSPEECPHIPTNYNIKNIKKKEENKIALQKRFGLNQDKNAFLLGIVSRFTDQKGFDLLEPIIDHLFENNNVQLAILGDGEPKYKEMIEKARQKFPDKIGYHFEFDVALPHLVFSGSDSILIPSRFEPCGIVQMQAMRYGTVPIIRKTGGLADTVENFDPKESKGEGFVFENYNPYSLFVAIIKAKTCFQFKKEWAKIMKRVMQKDFSWEKSAKKYSEVFNKLLMEKQKNNNNNNH